MTKLKYIILFVSVILLSACSDMHDPLLHAYGKTELRADVEIDAELQELGYTIPESFHLDFYDADSKLWVSERNMNGTSMQLFINYGWYDILFYNNDNQVLRFDYGEDKKHVTVSTETYPYVSLPDSLKGRWDVRQMPELLYSVCLTNAHISDKLEDYVFLPEENVYLLKLEAKLLPRVYIYKIDVEILHNTGQVTGAGNLTVTGLAPSIELMQLDRGNSPVAHQVPTNFQFDAEDCHILGQLTTFGSLSVSRSSSNNLCYIMLSYANGGKKCLPVDITQQMQSQPHGGRIHIVLDLNDIEPPKSTDGWNMEVNGWDEENHHQTI